MLRGTPERAASDWGSRLPWLFGGALVLALVPVVLYLPLILQLAIPVSLVVGLAFVSRPRESLLAVFALRLVVDLLWWAPGTVADLNVMELYSGVVAALAIGLSLMYFDRIQRHPYALPAAFMLIVMGIGALRSGEVRVGAEIVARFVSPLALMFLVSVLLEERRDWERLLALVPIVALVPVVLGFWHLANGQMNEYTLDGFNRLRGAYSNIHNHAHAMALFIVLGVFWLQRWGPGRRGALAAGYIAACGALLFLTYVRTPLVGVAAFTIVLLLAQRRYKLLIVAFAAFVVALMGSATLQERFADVAVLAEGDGGETGEVGSGRIHIWTSTTHRWLQTTPFDVLFGMGLDQHRFLSEKGLDSHNDYLALLTQMGPVALVTYLWFQVLVVIRGLRLAELTRDPFVRTFAQVMVGWTVMVFVTNLLSNSYVNRVHIAWLYWGFAGLLFAMETREHRRRPEQPGA